MTPAAEDDTTTGIDAEQLGALTAAVTVEDEVACDGLRVSKTDDGYRFELPDLDRRGLDESELERVARSNAPWVTNWYFWHDVAPDAGSPRYAFLRYLERVDDPVGTRETPDDGDTRVPSDDSDATEAAGDVETPSSHEDEAVRFDGDAVPARYDALASGMAREWGELVVSVALAEDGYRRYDVQHEEDADVPVGSLTEYLDPGDAREIATFDERDRYRPLKAAPTLRSGWVFPALTHGEVLTVVDYLYPATIANWYRAQTNSLDVDHWERAMARQSGIYGVIETWNRGDGHEHVEWVANACCDDSQCLKRREWEYDADTELDADPGDGVMPCREPCSVVVSAARRWTKLEGESSQTYEFELTPSEKEQLEAIVDAVADGTTEQIRDADVNDPANQLRARFLREKRVDDDGNLCGVPTDRDD
jgi:hypothetical protein